MGLQAARDLNVTAEYVAGGDINIYGGPTERQDYRFELEALLAHYLEVFVGRADELAYLEAVSTEDRPGYVLVEGAPGFGKSALSAQFVQRCSCDLVVFFIRAARQANTADAFLSAVNAQLLDVLGVPGGVPANLAEARAQLSSLWARAVRVRTPERPLVLLVDGLDESADGTPSIADLLPAALGPYVHVIVTSRPNPEPLKWVTREHPLRRAAVRRLERFGEADVAALLDDAALAPRVLALTRGEPLLARFACEDVNDGGVDALAEFERDPPEGVREYFDDQLAQLLEHAESGLARDALALLLVALGPIAVRELAAALDEPPVAVRRALDPIWRFLVGKERLELMHLELRAALMGEFLPRETTAARQRLLAADDGDYALEHRAGHLAEAGDAEGLDALLSREWMERKYARYRSHASFAHDLETVIASTGAGPISELELRARFLRVLLGHMAGSVPAAALGALAELGEEDVAEAHARMSADPDARIQVAIALLRRGKTERADALLEGIDPAEACLALTRAGLGERAVARLPPGPALGTALVHAALGDRERAKRARPSEGGAPRLEVTLDLLLGHHDEALTRIGAMSDPHERVASLFALLALTGVQDGPAVAMLDRTLPALDHAGPIVGACYVVLGRAIEPNTSIAGHLAAYGHLDEALVMMDGHLPATRAKALATAALDPGDLRPHPQVAAACVREAGLDPAAFLGQDPEESAALALVLARAGDREQAQAMCDIALADISRMRGNFTYEQLEALAVTGLMRGGDLTASLARVRRDTWRDRRYSLFLTVAWQLAEDHETPLVEDLVSHLEAGDVVHGDGPAAGALTRLLIRNGIKIDDGAALCRDEKQLLRARAVAALPLASPAESMELFVRLDAFKDGEYAAIYGEELALASYAFARAGHEDLGRADRWLAPALAALGRFDEAQEQVLGLDMRHRPQAVEHVAVLALEAGRDLGDLAETLEGEQRQQVAIAAATRLTRAGRIEDALVLAAAFDRVAGTAAIAEMLAARGEADRPIAMLERFDWRLAPALHHTLRALGDSARAGALVDDYARARALMALATSATDVRAGLEAAGATNPERFLDALGRVPPATLEVPWDALLELATW